MKKTILIAFICLTCNLVNFAQGNLQFNQVKLVTSVETVPAGKVWKVESVAYNGGGPFCISSGVLGCVGFTAYEFALMSYSVNGNGNFLGISAQVNTAANLNQATWNDFPMWLPAGTTLAAGTNMRYLSVVEFNVVP